MNLYICETYYHLLIALIKNITEKGKNDLIVSSKLTNDEEIYNNVKDSKIFRNIYKFKYTQKELENRKSRIRFVKNIILLIKMKKDNFLNFFQYEKIFLFNDNELYGKYLNYYKIHYNLLEDGKDCFRNNSIYWHKENYIKKKIKEKIFRLYKLGDSIYADSVEVNNKSGVKLRCKNIIEKPRKELFLSLNQKDKNNIFNIFIKDFKIDKFNNCNLLITQPLSEDGYLKSEKDKIEMYKYIIKEYLNNDKVIIKTHPREQTNYNKEFKEQYIIDKPFPIEILLFCEELKLSKVITVSSTSMSSLDFAKERKVLGWDWIQKYLEEVKNGEKK